MRRSASEIIRNLESRIAKLERLSSHKTARDVYQSFLKDLGGSGKIIDAYSHGVSVRAKKTNKMWDDGVPVLKYMSRARKQSVSVPEGNVKVVHDTNHGWWYFFQNGSWYGLTEKDYSRLPFDY